MSRIYSSGVTLIETLVYLALFAVVIGGLVTSAYAFFESNDRNQTKAMLQLEQDFIMARIGNVIESAQSISQPLVNGWGATLVATEYNGANVSCAQSGTDMRLNGMILNNSNVVVNRLMFVRKLSPDGVHESVEVGLTLSARVSSGMTLVQSASSTYYLRD